MAKLDKQGLNTFIRELDTHINTKINRLGGADRVAIKDEQNLFDSTNVEDALVEVKSELDGLELVASNVKMVDGTTVEDTVTTNKTSISNLQTRVNNGQNVKLTEDNGVCRDIPNNNANDITATGFYMGENVANTPNVTYNWIYIESKVHNDLYQIQIATDLHNSEKRWTRHKTSGTWSEWREL